uniref:Aminotransferase-like plant mobile domain-containing protein n=1 Tax=Solanum lycopersicum TaxID=4081 RepID=A0A3Q7EXE4_SOLLC
MVNEPLWMPCVPMFCLEIVEVHSPDRVMRQFGHSQHVTVIPSWGTNHHVHDQRRRLGTEVLEMMDKYFRDWQLRLSWPICLHVEHLRGLSGQYFSPPSGLNCPNHLGSPVLAATGIMTSGFSFIIV